MIVLKIKNKGKVSCKLLFLYLTVPKPRMYYKFIFTSKLKANSFYMGPTDTRYCSREVSEYRKFKYYMCFLDLSYTLAFMAI